MSAPDGSISVASFTAFDWLLVAVVVVSAAMAFGKGLIRVLFSLAGLIVGLLVASWNYQSVGDRLHPWVASVPVAQVLAFLTIILVNWFLFAIIAGIVRRAVKAVGLGFVDRLFGAVFGAVRGVLLGLAMLMALAAFAPGSSWARESVLAPYFLEGAHAVSFVVPQHFEWRMAQSIF